MGQKRSITSSEFPKRLRLLRQRKGLSQGQVAKKIGADPQRISKYERGVLYPTTELLLRLSELFEVSLDYLFCNGEAESACRIQNKDLMKYMEEADKLPVEKQKPLIALLDAFIKQQKLEELLRS